MKWDNISFILKSKHRQNLLQLHNKPKTPTQLAKIMKTSLANISLKLADLTDKGLIECINPNDLKGRIYRITQKGINVLKKISEMEK
jgi:predicted transcriptional regulator